VQAQGQRLVDVVKLLLAAGGRVDLPSDVPARVRSDSNR
jgi:hypothetical protein